MATLIQDDAQVRACEDINNMLSEVQVLNKALLSPGDPFSVAFGKGGRGRSITVDPAYADKLLAVLKLQRTKRIKDIKAKAAKFHIGLDEADLKLISDAAIEASAATDPSPAPYDEGQDPYAIQTF